MRSNTNKGITLIALIITIIILLILAGVTITMLTGENGILNQSQKSTIETYHGIVKDQVILGVNQYHVDKNTTGVSEDVVAYLLSNDYVKKVADLEYYRVNVETIAKNIKTGKGATKEEGDIYVIEEYESSIANSVKVASTSKADVQSSTKVADESAESTKQYVLRYYDKSGNTKDLLYLSGNGSYVDSNPNKDDDSKTDPYGDDEPGLDPTKDIEKPEDTDEDDDVQIPDAKVTKEIKCIEDLIDVAVDVNLKGKSYENEKIILTKSLDFTNKADYRDPDHYYSYNGENTEYYSLDSLKQVTTAGGTTQSDADAINDTGKQSANVFDELQVSSSFNAPGFFQIGDTKETSFKGIFDGQGNTISNMVITSNKTYNQGNQSRDIIGMFGYNLGYVYNLNLTLADIKLYESVPVGILVGNNNGVIKECSINTEVELNSEAPTMFAVISATNTGKINKCKALGTYTLSNAPTDFGVITTTNTGSITSCNIDGTYNLSKSPTNFSIISTINNGKIRKCEINPTVNITDTGKYPTKFSIIANNNFGQIYKCNISGEYSMSAGTMDNMGLLSLTNEKSGIIFSCSISGKFQKFNGGMPYFGTIAAFNLGKIKHCVVESTIEYGLNGSFTNFGGLVGKNEGTVACCENYYSNDMLIASNCAGGIVGENIGTVANCINYGGFDIKTSANLGGIIGKNDSTATVEKCNNGQKDGENATINGAYSQGVTGIIGSTGAVDEFTIENCHNYMNIDGNCSAGIISETELIGKINIINCNNYGKVNAVNSASGIVNTYNLNSSSSGTVFNVANCTNNGDVIGGSTICGGIVTKLDFYSKVTIANCINNGTVTQNSDYGGGIAGRIGYASADIINTTISNCQNNGIVNAGNESGGILGEANGSTIIKNCKNTGKINENISGNGIGGIVGYCKNNITINGCENTGLVNGYWGIGGILGWSCTSFDIQNSKNSGSIKCSYEDVAGIVGYAKSNSGNTETGNVFGCINTGEISGGARAAGIVGVNNISSNLTIKNCINEGTITGSSMDIAGICGNMQSAKIYNCGNKGTISGDDASGIGSRLYSGEIINCFNTGKIVGTQSSLGAGISAMCSGGLIKNCYNAATDITNGGGIISCRDEDSNTLENVYNISGIDAIVSVDTGSAISSTAITMSEFEMKAESFITTLNNNKESYTSWKKDTSNTNKGYPTYD